MNHNVKWMLALAGVLAIIVACQQSPVPTATSPLQGPSEGQARAMATPTPSPSPVIVVVPGPGSNNPIPMPAPSGVPGPKPPTPKPTPTPSGSPLPTPTPSGSPTPSPTPTPQPGNCPATLVRGVDTPTDLQSSSIQIAGFDPRCEVQTVEASFRITGELSQGTSSAWVILAYLSGARDRQCNLFEAGQSPDAPPLPLSGTQLGSTCTSLTFRDGAAPFRTASPPYDGVFRPFDVTGEAGANCLTPRFSGMPVNGSWILSRFVSGTDTTIQCWQIRFTLAIRPGLLEE